VKTMRTSIYLLIGTIAAINVNDSLAQEASDELILEEVIVTAQKREQSIQEVSLAVTAISGEVFDKASMIEVANLPDVATGFNIGSVGPGQNEFVARGVANLGGREDGSGAMGIYIDEAPISAAGPSIPEMALFDLERVEVLRGPQGTLFGEASMGGTLRLITNKPDTEEFYGRVAGSVSGTDGGGTNWGANGTFNMPLVGDKLAARVLIGYKSDDGWIDIPDLDLKDANAYEQKDARLAFRWFMSGSSTADYSYTYHDLDSDTENQQTSVGIFDPRSDALPWGAVAHLEALESQYDLHNLTFTFDFDFASLVAASSYYDKESFDVRDLSPLSGLLFGAGEIWVDRDATQKLFTQEIRLVSNGDNRFDWTIGAYYKNNEIYSNNAWNVELPFLMEVGIFDVTNDIEALAFYAEGDLEFAETWSLTVGARYFTDDRTLTTEQITNSFFLGIPAGQISTSSQDASEFLPSGTLAWQPSDEVNLFARVATGFKPGGAQTESELSDEIPDGFDPEYLTAYEFGVKTTGLMKGMLANFYVFYNDWTDLQLSDVTSDGLFGFTANAGAARAYGAELEISARLTDSLMLSLDGAYTDAEISETVLNGAGGIVAEKGSKIPLVSEWTTNVSLDYDFPVGDTLQGSFFLGYSYRSPNYSDAANNEAFENDDYHQLRARLGVERDSWGLYLFASNLLNEDNSILKYSFTANAPLVISSYSRPRTIGLQFSANF